MNFTRWVVLTLVASLGLLTATAARADTEPRVIDDAHFFKPETVQKADEQLRQLKSETGVEIVVETFGSIPDGKRSAYETAKDDAQQKDEFFAAWARERGKELKVFGAYVLIVKDPAHLHVVAGSGTERKAFPLEDQRKVRDAMLGPFKEKNFDEGLLKGIAEARDLIKRKLAGQKLQTTSAYDPFTAHRSTGSAAARGPAGSSSGGSRGSRGPVAGGSPSIPQTTSGSPRSGGSVFHGSCMWIVLIIIGVIVLFSLLGRLGGSRRYGGGPGYGGGGPGYGPGYGGPGYGGGYGPPPARGGGFMSGLFGGLLGGAAGSYFENRMENRGQGGGISTGNTGYAPPPDAGTYGGPPDTGAGGDFGSSSSGTDFDTSGGDTGAGGDFGGGGGGGDFGGGGDSGSGGDFGGGGGDSGGGTGGDF